MDLSTLRRLASEGFGAVPGDHLTDLAAWCRDYCETTGDARYCIVDDTLRAIDGWWTEYDDAGGVPAVLVIRIERVVTTLLPSILDAADPADAAPVARVFREEVQALLLPSGAWEGLD